MSTPPNASDDRPSIALIGFRGAGKTAVGHALAERLGGTHVDTDDLIVERSLMTITQIFKTEGEAGFREHERDAVAQVVVRTPTVISVGGGAVLDEINIRRLRAVARMVWLTAPARVLWQRIKSDPSTGTTRPALSGRSGEEEVEKLLEERGPLYEQAADFTVNTLGKEPSALAEEIVTILNLTPA
jgi:shikimate kinase